MRTLKMWSVYVGMMLLAAGLALGAAAADKTEKAEKKAGKQAARLQAPKGMNQLNKVSGLTDEQKAKITEIHAKAEADRKALDEKEMADVQSVLTDVQKAELKKLQDEQKAAADAKAAEKKKAVTEPGAK